MNTLNHLKSEFVRAAILLVIMLAATTARAEEITIALADGHGSATFSEESLVFSNCEALEVGFSFDIPLEVMTQSKAYGGVVMQNYTATLDNGDVVDGLLTGEIDVVSSQTYRYRVTGNKMTRRPVSVNMTRSSSNGPVEIATWSGFRKGAASFTFDDGAPSHVSDAGPMFKKYGYKATFNLVVNWNPNWSGFQGLADEGHEIASHSNSHGNNMSGEEVSSKDNIKGKINQKYGVITVAYPNCNVPNESAVLQNYIVGRICNGSWKGLSDIMGKDGPSNWAKVPAIMTGATGTNDFKGNMQKAVQQGGWIAFLTHGLEGKNNGNATYSPTPIGSIEDGLKWAQQNDKDIWVAPMGHVAMYIKERKASKVEVTQSDETSMTIELTHNIKDNVSDYDYPLSLRVKSDWNKVEVTQGGAELENKIDGGYIYFDAIPNGGAIVVTNKLLTITADSGTKSYDGTALTKNSYTYTGLAPGDVIVSVTVTGSQTAVGTSDNVASAAVIKNGDVDVTANYIITYVKGTLAVTTKTVSSPTITLSETSYVYDGQAKEPAVSSVKVGDTVIPASEYTVAYENNTNAGTATVKIVDKDGGNYTVSGSTTFEIVLMGDANGDRKVDAADIVEVVNYLNKKPSNRFNKKLANVTGSSDEVDEDDLKAIVNLVMGQ